MRRRTAGLVTLAVIAVLGAWVYTNRIELILEAMRIASARRTPTIANAPISWSSGPDPFGRPREARPPNIVLILADDLGWNDLSLNGGGVAGGRVATPNIDAIADKGVQFTQGYAANATCAPSRAALLSGRYATRFGFEFTPTPPGMMQIVPRLPTAYPRLRRSVIHEGAEPVPFEEMGMPASEITIAELLAERGYHTVHIGKWHVGRTNGMAPHEQGFAESLLMTSGLYLPEDDPGVVNAKQDFDPIDRFLWANMQYAAAYNGEPAMEPKGYLTDYYTDQAVSVIEANRERPFFLYLAHWAPHTPLQATREDYDALEGIEPHRARVYGAMVRALDRSVGRVLEALERNGLSENTLVLFTSDNGGAGYIGLPDVNAPFRGWKMSFFEGGIHVPFLAKWPGRIAPGTRYDAPVHHFDLYATAAAAAGAPLPTDREIDGVDLLPFVAGASGVPHRALFWKSGASRTALVDGWKLNVSDPPGRTWLYDLGTDPTEQHDLSGAHPARVAALRAALETHEASQAPPAWPAQLTSALNLDKDLSVPDAEGDAYIYWTN